ncbi:SafA/ExsA family spore coat assembly protein [Geobacillus thermodenitrificans]|uniref:SafA/ExsA family spore coat assembly protein n=1 Tax=Geobacillus thermodenitrificans TaxID=33940 RepID=UPI0035B514D8
MKIHIVQKGDTLWKIAQKYGVDFEQLKKINGHLSDPNMIMPGMKIKVPTAGVPIKKETKTYAPSKKPKVGEHPYAETKPFVSFNIDAEMDTASGAVSENEIPVNEAPKAVEKEKPKAPAAKAPKAEVKEKPKAPAVEAPKAEGKGTAKAPISGTSKGMENKKANVSVNEAPNVPVNETPNVPVNEAPNVPVNETPNVPANEAPKAPTAYTPPLTHTIPPVVPTPHVSFAKSLPNLPPIPPKPSNILPGMMKEEMDESPTELKGEQTEIADESEETPPPLPNIPHVPIAPMTAPVFGVDQGCVPVTPILPGAGFYMSPPPAMPSYSPPPGSLGGGPENNPAPFPGISEGSNDSLESPQFSEPGKHGAAAPLAPPAGAAFAASGPAAPGYAPSGVYAPLAGYPPFGYVPVYPPTPYYGGYAPPGVYAQPAPYGYAPQQAAQAIPWPGAVYPVSPPAAGSRLFAGPPDEESEHGEEQ